MATDKAYDRAYFERYYHDHDSCVMWPAEVARQAAVAVTLAEYYLGRPVERVLDVGCGEGHWREPLLKLRPRIAYTGLDPSEYAVARYGHERNIHQMSFDQLAEQRFGEPFDIVICANVLQYLDPTEIRRGLSGFAEILHGVAFLETYVRGDEVVGDLDGFKQRTARWYREAFAEAGLVPCGPQAWLSADLLDDLPALDLPAGT